MSNDDDFGPAIDPFAVDNYNRRDGPRAHVRRAIGQVLPFRTESRVVVEHLDSIFDSFEKPARVLRRRLRDVRNDRRELFGSMFRENGTH